MLEDLLLCYGCLEDSLRCDGRFFVVSNNGFYKKNYNGIYGLLDRFCFFFHHSHPQRTELLWANKRRQCPHLM